MTEYDRMGDRETAELLMRRIREQKEILKEILSILKEARGI
jgi:hypothetical protein